VHTLSAYVGPVDSAPYNQYSVAIYTDQAGAPGTLVAQSGLGSLSANNWNTMPVTATLHGTTAYWLVYTTNASSNSLNDLAYNAVGSTMGAYATTSQPVGSWPATFGSASMQGSQYALYATVSP
jgi:hypothetical protein